MQRIGISGIAVGLTLLAATVSVHAFDGDSLVWKKCTICHAPTAEGRIPRVEDLRTTPEEWTVIVDRMRRLHGMPIGQGEMDRLLKELCTTQILTPEEQSRVSYLSLWHNSQQVEAPAGKDEEKLFTTCVRCHTAGKIFSYRMTPDQWAKLRDFHLAVAPTVIFQMREMHWIAEADAVLAKSCWL
jgi:cytochrome c553